MKWSSGENGIPSIAIVVLLSSYIILYEFSFEFPFFHIQCCYCSAAIVQRCLFSPRKRKNIRVLARKRFFLNYSVESSEALG